MTYHKPYIIAEAGVNHNGSLQTAKDLVHVAADSGASAVKFQYFKADTLVTKSASQAPYQRTNSPSNSQHSMLSELELSLNQLSQLKQLADSLSIDFLCTAFGSEELLSLLELGISLVKIPSGEIDNIDLLYQAGKSKLPIILSTGTASFDEVSQTYSYLTSLSNESIYILHCTSLYPTPPSLSNIANLVQLRTLTPNIGFSDHTETSTSALMAVSYGASIFEKHYTLSRTLPGPDHLASAEPLQLKQYISDINEAFLCLGSSERHLSDAELQNRFHARRSIKASTHITPGEPFTRANTALARPASGLSPFLYPKVLEQVSTKSFKPGDDIII